jgi:hypothetical protein
MCPSCAQLAPKRYLCRLPRPLLDEKFPFVACQDLDYRRKLFLDNLRCDELLCMFPQGVIEVVMIDLTRKQAPPSQAQRQSSEGWQTQVTSIALSDPTLSWRKRDADFASFFPGCLKELF